MTTAIVNLLNRPITRMRARDNDDSVHRDGIFVQPWLVALIISVSVQLMGIAFFAGTIMTRIEAIDARVQRIERQLDSPEKTRSPQNHVSPPMPNQRPQNYP